MHKFNKYFLEADNSFGQVWKSQLRKKMKLVINCENICYSVLFKIKQDENWTVMNRTDKSPGSK